MVALCRRHDILLIADEVLCGMGRTGRMFACEHFDLVPDILVLGKGLNAGALPLSAVVARRPLVERLAAGSGGFNHAQTYSHHPALCAAGLATLRALVAERLVERVARLEAPFFGALASLRAHPAVGDIRGRGFLAAIEFVADRATRQPFDRALPIRRALRRAGIRQRAHRLAERRQRRGHERRPRHRRAAVHRDRRGARRDRSPPGPDLEGDDMSESRRITYTSTTADPEFRATFDRQLARVRGRFPIALGGNVGEGPVEGLPEHPVVSPIDTRLIVAEVAIATPGEVESAVGFAHAAFPGWRALAWERRVRIVRDAAERSPSATSSWRRGWSTRSARPGSRRWPRWRSRPTSCATTPNGWSSIAATAGRSPG